MIDVFGLEAGLGGYSGISELTSDYQNGNIVYDASDGFLTQTARYLAEVGYVMERDHPYLLKIQGDPFSLGKVGVVSSSISSVSYLPKALGYSNSHFIQGGRVAFRWANQFGTGVKAISAAELGTGGVALALVSAWMTGYTIGAVIDSYIQGAVQCYEKNKKCPKNNN